MQPALRLWRIDHDLTRLRRSKAGANVGIEIDDQPLREKLYFFLARKQDDISNELKTPPPVDPSELEWQEIEVG